jgi:hypothetical protein
LAVLSAVQLYGKLHRWTVKVYDIGAYAVLAEEFYSNKLSIPYLCPQNPFRIRLITP